MVENLRLAAVIDDKFSAPLKKLQSGLKEVGGREHSARMTEQAAAFLKAHEASEKFGEGLKRILEPAMAATGLAAIGLGAGLTGVIETVGQTGKKLADLGRISAQIRMSSQQILEGQALFSKYGMSVDQSNAALRRFADSMHGVDLRQGDFYKALVGEGGAVGQAEAERLRSLKGNLQAQYEELLRFFARIKDPITRAHYALIAMGDEAVAHVGDSSGKQLDADIENARKVAEKVSGAAIDAGKKYEAAYNSITNKIATEWSSLAESALPVMTEMTDAVNDFIDANSTPLKSTVVAALKDFQSFDWKGLVGGFGDFVRLLEVGAGALNALLEAEHRQGEWMQQHVWRPLGGENALDVITRHPYETPVAPEVTARTSPIDAPGLPDSVAVDQRALGLLPGTEEYGREHARAEAYSRLPTMPSIADLPFSSGVENALETKPNDPSGFFIPPGDAPTDDSVSKDKQTALQKTIQESAIRLSLRDVSLDAERRIADWWKKAILKGLDAGLDPDTPESQAAAAALASNPTGYSAPGPRSAPLSRNPAVRPGGDAGGQYKYPPSPGSGNLTKLITDASERHGVDPSIMEGIRAGESGHSRRYDVKDDALESSWGPFQLNRRSGLGVQFEKETAAERARLGVGERSPKILA